MFTKILVGIDGSEQAKKTLKRAKELKNRFDAELIVYHAVDHHLIQPSIALPTPIFGSTSTYSIPQVDYEKIRQAYIDKGKLILGEAEEFLGNSDPKIRTKLIIDQKPEDYAIQAAEKENVDLIVLGTKGDHNIIEKLIGSVSEKVMNEATCDVLLVK